MVAIEIGRVCRKLQGREAGRHCVVIEEVTEGYVEITGPRELTNVRRRKCNILHIEPTSTVIEIKKGASDAEVLKALEAVGISEKIAVKKERPTPKVESKGKESAPKAKKKESAPKVKKKESEPKVKKKESAPKAKKKESKPKVKKD